MKYIVTVDNEHITSFNTLVMLSDIQLESVKHEYAEKMNCGIDGMEIKAA